MVSGLVSGFLFPPSAPLRTSFPRMVPVSCLAAGGGLVLIFVLVSGFHPGPKVVNFRSYSHTACRGLTKFPLLSCFTSSLQRARVDDDSSPRFRGYLSFGDVDGTSVPEWSKTFWGFSPGPLITLLL